MSCQLDSWFKPAHGGHAAGMLIVIAHARAQAARLADHELQNLFGLAALPGDGLEHLYVAIRPDGAELVFFMSQPDIAAARVAVRRLCHRALARSAALRGWSLDESLVGLTPGVDFRVSRDQAGRVRVLPPQEPDSSNC